MKNIAIIKEDVELYYEILAERNYIRKIKELFPFLKRKISYIEVKNKKIRVFEKLTNNLLLEISK